MPVFMYIVLVEIRKVCNSSLWKECRTHRDCSQKILQKVPPPPPPHTPTLNPVIRPLTLPLILRHAHPKPTPTLTLTLTSTTRPQYMYYKLDTYAVMEFV